MDFCTISDRKSSGNQQGRSGQECIWIQYKQKVVILTLPLEYDFKRLCPPEKHRAIKEHNDRIYVLHCSIYDSQSQVKSRPHVPKDVLTGPSKSGEMVMVVVRLY